MTLRPLLRCLVLLGWCAAAIAAPSDDFRLGIQAFGNQDYDSALHFFIAARDGGMRTPSLHYNLGATYFRLGRFDDSFAEYEALSTDAAWSALAHYNLGLIDEIRGRPALAAEHYRKAFDLSANLKLRALAAARIESTSTAIAQLDERSWHGLVALAVGYDDNVLLSNGRESLVASNQEDTFTELNAVAGKYISGNLDDGWQMDLAAYYRAYAELDDFNFGVGQAGATYGHLFENWYIQTGPRIELHVNGGDYADTVGSVHVQALRPLGTWVLRLRTEYAFHEPAESYDFIGGSQLRAGFDVTRRLPRTRLRLIYEFEDNNRQDLVNDAEYFSYSPQRHRVAADLKQDLFRRLQLAARIEYRVSRFKDVNTQTDNGSAVSGTREDTRLAGAARLSIQPLDVGTFFVDYQYTDNDSSFDQYSYVSGQLSVGFDYPF